MGKSCLPACMTCSGPPFKECPCSIREAAGPDVAGRDNVVKRHKARIMSHSANCNLGRTSHTAKAIHLHSCLLHISESLNAAGAWANFVERMERPMPEFQRTAAGGRFGFYGPCMKST